MLTRILRFVLCHLLYLRFALRVLFLRAMFQYEAVEGGVGLHQNCFFLFGFGSVLKPDTK